MSDPASDQDRFFSELKAGYPALSDIVLKAAATIPRGTFIPVTGARPYGYGAIPIDCGEVMPDAATAIRLVDALELKPEHRVLEIGTGSGYVTALLARMALHVTSLDRFRRLLAKAEVALQRAEVTNVSLFLSDGSEGYPDGAPYDRVVIHSAFPAPPRIFLDQMAQQSLLVCAVGGEGEAQTLVRLQKVGARFERRDLWSVRYQRIGAGIAKAL
ncbi:methyltransferase domain-containing protein [Fulvimarina sp. 2208YS6-2-32]|uniref:Protein-L-isoaspartate O-methyltransferase n=1 Tax=Fulvimarina uroteuthidis TaxID=3098149 RepID=A0ABU5I6R3_9HYPH|nr:methyltransferase domain-containing protein [Fulvimarina sp. 2208YS6-2-32]MDY8110598.1 methyltransferase domain-containing protein [Fulvimarina sp. 2208YS6-2-32]